MHPVHASMTNISYSTDKKAFEITVRLYKNDFQKIISKNYDYTLQFEENFPSDSDKFYVTDYVKRHLIFIAKKKGYNNFQFDSYKVNFEAIWLNFSLPFKKQTNKIILYNSLFNDLFDDQKNLVIFSYLGNEKGFTFSKNNEDKEILLK